MKSCMWITLLSLAAMAYGASVVTEAESPQFIITKEMEAEVLKEAGKSLETLGRILQGKDVPATQETQDEVAQVMRAFSSDEALSEDAAEYIWPIIARGGFQGGVAHGVHKWLNRKG